jgi:hypothetical protein
VILHGYCSLVSSNLAFLLKARLVPFCFLLNCTFADRKFCFEFWHHPKHLADADDRLPVLHNGAIRTFEESDHNASLAVEADWISSILPVEIVQQTGNFNLREHSLFCSLDRASPGAVVFSPGKTPTLPRRHCSLANNLLSVTVVTTTRD